MLKKTEMSRNDDTWTTNVASGANFFTDAATDNVSRPDATTNKGPSLVAIIKFNAAILECYPIQLQDKLFVRRFRITRNIP